MAGKLNNMVSSKGNRSMDLNSNIRVAHHDTVPATESNINRNSNVAAKLVNVAELELAKKKTEECKTNLLKNGIIHHMCELISKWLFGQLWRKERLKCVSS
ncbi:hypothetical protein OUZ56_024742 [Daphnia magna]|uniref:Uncharacterized protein n=1 Tax=Daphnia magna TaxID=35525 RepID=A0ABQ9ZII1_9CRUS|nr:hypothetical protein OUZ56_024742 [Daphnia magna]